MKLELSPEAKALFRLQRFDSCLALLRILRALEYHQRDREKIAGSSPELPA
jgi:hypothetical protein